MGWRDELETASYRGVEFEVRRIEVGGGKKGAEHDKPLQIGGAAEDTGNKMRRFDVQAYYVGRNFRAERNRLERALQEEGAGELIHPSRGLSKVLPVDWNSAENIDADGPYVTFSIVFTEDTFSATPIIAESSEDVARFSIAEHLNALADRFDEALDFSELDDVDRFLADINAATAIIDTRFAASVERSLQARFKTLSTVVANTAEALIPGSAGVVAANLISMLGTAAQSTSDAGGQLSPTPETPVVAEQRRTQAPRRLAGFGQELRAGLPPAGYSIEALTNRAAFTETLGSASIAASALATLGATFRTRDAAEEALGQLTAAFQEHQEQLQENEARVAEQFPDGLTRKIYQANGESLSELTQIVVKTTEAIKERSRGLESERSIVLTEDRTILNLAFELYGNIERVDDLIEVNRINEPLLLRKGTRVLYYA